MKHIRLFLAAVLTLSLVAGFGGFPMKQTASAAAKKTITVKAAADFTIKLPAKWKNNYVMQRSGKKEQGSFVAFSSKRCYKETGEGWLFSIMRYKDDSYTDLPQYELVGRWNGLNYVAVFPTDIQTMGATKTAKQQYHKMNGDSLNAAASVQPFKKTSKGTYRARDFSLKLPVSWKGNYTVKNIGKNKRDSSVAFYGKKCYNETKLGWLFSIARYEDESYQELPAYELVGMWNGIRYVAVFPTDVQFEGAAKEAVKQYQKLSKSVEKVARSIQR